MTDFLTKLDAIQPAPTPIPSHDEAAVATHNARDLLKQDVIEHFQRHHGLQLNESFELQHELPSVPHEQLTRRVLAWVTERLGGRSQLDVATETLRDAFARRVYRPKRQGRHLTLGGYLYVEDDYGGGKRLSYGSRDDLGKLATVLHRFEHDEIITVSTLHHALHQVTDYYHKTSFGVPIGTFNPHCTTITLYKNGNVRTLDALAQHGPSARAALAHNPGIVFLSFQGTPSDALLAALGEAPARERPRGAPAAAHALRRRAVLPDRLAARAHRAW